MRTSITLGRLRGSTEFEFVFGPDTPMVEQRAWIKAQRQSKRHDRYDEVQLWGSDTGRTVVHRFRTDEVPVPSEQPKAAVPQAEPVAAVEAEAPAPEQPAAEPIVDSESQDASGDFDVADAMGKRRRRR